MQPFADACLGLLCSESEDGAKSGDVAAKTTRRQFLEGMLATLPVVAAATGCAGSKPAPREGATPADLIVTNGKIATLNRARPSASAVAIKDGRFVAVGSDSDVAAFRGPATKLVDARGRTVVPGLNDSHTHVIRGGLNYNLELRWDGVPSLADGLRMIREQAQRTPPPHWVRVVGGFSRYQFAEKRLPTLEELDAAAPDTPVFLLELYHSAMLNRAALRAVGYTKDTPDPPGALMQRDAQGNPTGLLVARPNAFILYATLAKGPKLSYAEQLNSSRQFMRELNRLGVTSVLDAGGGFQNYPNDYAVIADLAKQGLLSLRINYNLFTQRPKKELDDYKTWAGMAKPGQGDDFYRLNGAGELLVYSALDFENFPEPRPDLPSNMESDLGAVVKLLVENRWPFRLHATYDESIQRFLNVFEAVNREVPFGGLRWNFDHAETISPRSLERVLALGGGVAVQNRMVFQGEDFTSRYGAERAAEAPPIRRMLSMGVPLGIGTDATRVSSYNPWVALHWVVAGKTAGGNTIYPPGARVDREQALRLLTAGSAWFSGEESQKGTIEAGRLADLAVLSSDYFSVPEDRIASIESVLTLVGGRPVYGAGEFAALAPAALPVVPEWSPVKSYGASRAS